jgi:hypothetical protein
MRHATSSTHRHAQRRHLDLESSILLTSTSQIVMSKLGQIRGPTRASLLSWARLGRSCRRSQWRPRHHLICWLLAAIQLAAITATSSAGFVVLNDQHTSPTHTRPPPSVVNNSISNESNNSKQAPKYSNETSPRIDRAQAGQSATTTTSDETKQVGQNGQQDPLLNLDTVAAPQFDDDEQANGNDHPALGLAKHTYTLQPGEPAARFDWAADEAAAAANEQQVSPRLAPSSASNHAARTLLANKYQMSVQRTLHSRPRKMQLVMESGHNSSRPFRRFVETEQDSSAAHLIENQFRAGAQLEQTAAGGSTNGPSKQKWRPNKKFLKLKYPHETPARHKPQPMLGGEVRVQSDLVLVKDQASTADAFGLPVKTLSERVEIGSGGTNERLQSAQPPSELLIVDSAPDDDEESAGGGVGGGAGDGFVVVAKTDGAPTHGFLGGAQEDASGLSDRYATTAPSAAQPQAHRFQAISLTEMLRVQANELPESHDEREESSTLPLADRESASKRTSEPEDELNADANRLNREQDELNQAASSSNSMTGISRLPSRLIVASRRGAGDTRRPTLPLAAATMTTTDAIMTDGGGANRRFGQIVAATQGTGGGGRGRPAAAYQQLKSAAASTSEIRVTIGDSARPVFINNRGLITASKKRNSTTTRRPLYNPSKLFASSQGSYTLNPLESTTIIRSRPAAGGQQAATNDGTNKGKYGAGLSTTNKLGGTLSIWPAPAPQSNVTSAPATFVQLDGQAHNWNDRNQYQVMTNNKRNHSMIGHTSNGNKVSLVDVDGAAGGAGKQTGVNSLATTLVSSLLAISDEQPEQPQQQQGQGLWPPSADEQNSTGSTTSAGPLFDEHYQRETNNRFNLTRPTLSLEETTATSQQQQPSTTTIAANFNHNPPYKLHSSAQETAVTPADFGHGSSWSAGNSSSSSPSSSSMAENGNKRNASRPNNRFHAGGQNSSATINKSHHHLLGIGDSGGPAPNRNSTNRRPAPSAPTTTTREPPIYSKATTTSPSYESGTTLSEPVNTLQANSSFGAGFGGGGLQQSAANATASGPGRPANKIRIKLHNLLLNKFLIKPIQQQQAQMAAAAASQQGGGGQTSSLGSPPVVQPAPLLSNTVANNVAQLLAQKLGSLVRSQAQQQQQQTQTAQWQHHTSTHHAGPSPLNSLFGLRAPSSSTSSSSSTAGSTLTKLKQRVNPFAGGQPQVAAGLGLSHRRTAGVGSLLVSGLVYGLTVLPALMALTGINPLNSAGSTGSGGGGSLAALAEAGASGQSLAANRHSADKKSKPRPKANKPNRDKGDNGGEPSDSFAFVIPLLSPVTPAVPFDATDDHQQTALPITSHASSLSTAALGSEPQSSALRSLYAPPPTILEPSMRAGTLPDIGGLLDDSPEIDWSAYTSASRPSGQELRDSYHHAGTHLLELGPLTDNHHYNHHWRQPEAGGQRVGAARIGARRHRDLSTNVGSGSGSNWRPALERPVAPMVRTTSQANPTMRPGVGLFDEGQAAAAGGAQPSVGSVAFELPGSIGSGQQPAQWSQPVPAKTVNLSHQNTQQQQQQQQQRQQQKSPFAPLDQLIQAGPVHETARDAIGQPQRHTDPIRWNVGIGFDQRQPPRHGPTGFEDHGGGSRAQNDSPRQQDNSLINTPQELGASRQAQSPNFHLDELAILGQYRPGALADGVLASKQTTPADFVGGTDDGSGGGGGAGLRQRRTIVNRQQQPQQFSASLGGARMLSSGNQHEGQLTSPLSSSYDPAGFSNELQLLHQRDQLRSNLIGSGQQEATGQHTLGSTAAQSMILSQQNKLIHQNEDGHKSNRLRASQTDQTTSLGNHLNLELPRWSSASEWRAVAAPPRPSDTTRTIHDPAKLNNFKAKTNAGLDIRESLPVVADLTTTKDDIEIIVGRKLPTVGELENKSTTTTSTTKRPRGKKKSSAKKSKPTIIPSKLLYRNDKSTKNTTPGTTKASTRLLKDDGGESELILAHSMAMGSRFLNEPIKGPHHD